MHKSDELQEVVHAVFERLNELNFELDTAIIIIFTEGSKDTVWWLQNSANQQYLRIAVDYADILYLRNLFEAKENKKICLRLPIHWNRKMNCSIIFLIILIFDLHLRSKRNFSFRRNVLLCQRP